MDEPKEWANPIFAVLHNLLLRGCPTFPSLYLRQEFGVTGSTINDKYSLDFDNLNWDSIIRGGDTSNPGLYFYRHILPKYVPLAGSFIPEFPVSEILQNKSDARFRQVDFYSPIYNTAIEIDGTQHSYGEQQVKDITRDELFKRNGIQLIRITTSELTNESIVKNKLAGIEKTRLDFIKTKLSQMDTAYCSAIRLQLLLLYLYATEKIELSTNKLNLYVFADFNTSTNTIQAILDDFYMWLKNIAALQHITITKPVINLTICKSEQELIHSKALKVDISLTKVYSAPKESDVYYIRNDYFPFSKQDDIVQNTNAISNAYESPIVKRNYYRVACASIAYDVSIEEHKNNLLYLLRNISNGSYKDFRANQLQIITTALNCRSVIGLLPTGAGKSLCYQITALLIPSMTIVVEPLKLLMLDQYEHLCDNLGINNSTYIDSSHTEHLSLFTQEQSLITLVSPERFFSKKFADSVSSPEHKGHIGFIVIDEAHCLSEWGHDFRTSYLCLSHNLATILPPETYLMALTGTASPSALKDIENEFYYFKQKVVPTISAETMRRDNLNVVVKSFSEQFDMYNALFDTLYRTLAGRDNKKTLVFTKTKRARTKDLCASACLSLCERLSEESKQLTSKKVVNVFAGGDEISDDKKERLLNDFKGDTDLRVLVATKAFGMGIDINDIARTIHYGLPSSIEGLYQQIGRAGRDREQFTPKKPAECYIFFREEDKKWYNYFFNRCGDKETTIQHDITIQEILDNQDNLKELNTNFFFIQNANLDVETELKVVERLLKGIRIRNEHKADYVDCATMCDVLLRDVNDTHLNSLLMPKGKLTSNATIILERALYRLFLLGEIEMWNVVYGSDVINPTYTNLRLTEYSEDNKLERLKKHIERYDSRAEVLPSINTFEERAKALLEWSYKTFLLERIKSMKTLYDWCLGFSKSTEFMDSMEFYFTCDPLYLKLTEQILELTDWYAPLRRNPQETKKSIARLLEAYENRDPLNYVSGITRLRLGEFSDSDGERRLNMSFGGIKQMSEQMRMELFVETYKFLDSNIADTFVEKWLRYIPEDARKIYDYSRNPAAENFIIINFANDFIKVKEKLYDRLHKNG